MISWKIVLTRVKEFGEIFGVISALYEGCLLNFRIRKLKQILIIENGFIVFKNVPH